MPHESVQHLNFSSPASLIILIAVVFTLVLGAFAYARMFRRNTFQPRNPFATTEDDHANVERHSIPNAEAKFAYRASSVCKINIRDFNAGRRNRFTADWRGIEARFIDHPKGAVIEADELVTSLLNAGGYRLSGLKPGAEDLSMSQSRLVDYYSAAHEVAMRTGMVSTEELRSAMLDYRTLFDELVRPQPPVELKSAS